MKRLALALFVVLGLAAPAAAQEPDPLDTVPGTEVVVVGVPGLRWSDVDPQVTPVLHRLAQDAAVGALSVKARPVVSCPAEGWLTLAAGSRAEAPGTECGDLPAEPPVEENLATRDAADVRALADALAAAGACLAARGDGPLLAGGDPSRACPALLLEAPPVEEGLTRSDDAAAADALVSAVDAARDARSTLVVVGLSGTRDDDEAHLHLALAAGPSFEAGALRSASTRRAPYVQLVDVAPTVLELLDVDVPEQMTGQPWRSTGEDPGDLADLDRRAVESKRAWVPFFVVLVGGFLLAAGAARARRSWRTAEAAGLAAVGALGGSYLAMLAPWWRAPLPLLALVALSAVAGGLALLARRVPGRTGPAAAVCAAVALVLVVDLLTGARLQVDAPAGYSPLVAGRFAGVGNVAFGVLAACALLTLAPRRPLLLVAGGLLVVVADGAPPFGSDVGGVLALVPALVLLALLRTGREVRLTTLLGAGLAAVVVVTGFAVADWRRDPQDRTHLGRFVEQVRDGTAGTVLARKAEAIGNLLFANAATALLPLGVAAAAVLLLRPPRQLREAFDAAPAWRHGLLAVGLVSLLGFVLNDSGPAVPAFALLVAVPATTAVVARAPARRGNDPTGDG